MADQGIVPVPPSGTVGPHRVWTFLITSGPDFRLDMPRTPALEFTGSRTIWKMVGSEALANAVGQFMTEMGVKWERFSEGQTEEQRQERMGLLHNPEGGGGL